MSINQIGGKYFSAIAASSNKRFRSWLAPRSRSNLMRYEHNKQFDPGPFDFSWPL